MDHEELLGPAPDTASHEELIGPPPDSSTPSTPQSKTVMAKQAIGSALDTDIPVLSQVQKGLQGASDTAGKFYSAAGYPKTGKAVQMGGRVVASMIPAKMKDALFLAAAGPALEGVGAAGKAMAGTEAGQAVVKAGATAVKTGGDILSNIAGVIAGKDPEVLRTLAKSPGAVWNKASELFSMAHQENLDKIIDEAHGKIGEKFGALEDQFAGYHGTPTAGTAPKVDLQGVFDTNVKDMLGRGHRLPKDISGIKPTTMVGRIASDDPEYGAIMDKLNVLKKNPQMNFGEALNFRRQIDQSIEYGVEGSNGMKPLSGEAQRVLKGIRKGVSSSLRDSLPNEVKPEWDSVNKSYQEGTAAFNELRKQIIRQSPGQTENKLLQLVKEGRYDDEVTRRAQALGDKVIKSLDDARDHVAARSVKRWVETPNAAHFFGAAPRPMGYAASAAGAAGQGASILAGKVVENPKTAIMAGKAAQGLIGAPSLDQK